MPAAASSRPRIPYLNEIGLVYCAAIWGSTFFVVKDALSGVDPVVLVAYRFSLAALLLLPIIRLRGGKPFAGMFISVRGGGVQPPDVGEAVVNTAAGRRRHSAGKPSTLPGRVQPRPYTLHASPGVVLGLLLWVLYIAQTWGLGITTASNSGFITGMFIIFIPLLSYLMHERAPTPGQLGAVGIAVAGLYLLTGGIGGLNSGDILTLLAAVTYALHVMFTGRFSAAGLDPYVLCFQQVLVVGLLSFAAAFVLGLPFGVSGVEPLAQILFLTVFPTLSAFLIQLLAQRTVPELRVSLIFTLEPVFGALFSWTLGGEQLIPLRALGGLLIVAAMLVSELGNKRTTGHGTRDTGTV